MSAKLTQYEIRSNLSRLRDKRPILRSAITGRELNSLDSDTYLICVHITELLFKLEEHQAEEASKATFKTRYDDESPCPIGKNKGYAGKPLREVPDDFLLWAYSQPWLQEKYGQLHEYIKRAVINKENVNEEEDQEAKAQKQEEDEEEPTPFD